MKTSLNQTQVGRAELQRCQEELREKKREIAALAIKFEKLHGSHKADSLIQKEQMKQLDFFKNELQRKEAKCNELRQRITLLETQVNPSKFSIWIHLAS